MNIGLEDENATYLPPFNKTRSKSLNMSSSLHSPQRLWQPAIRSVIYAGSVLMHLAETKTGSYFDVSDFTTPNEQCNDPWLFGVLHVYIISIYTHRSILLAVEVGSLSNDFTSCFLNRSYNKTTHSRTYFPL